MSLAYKSHVKNNHAHLKAKPRRKRLMLKHASLSFMKTKSGNGSAIAIFLATFSLCLWGGGVFFAKWKIDTMQANIELLSSMANANNCATGNLAAESQTSSRNIAATSKAQDPFAVSHSPLFSMNSPLNSP
jgi:hypothetical protein